MTPPFPPPTNGPLLVVPDAPPDWEAAAVEAGWRVIDGTAVPDDPWDLAGVIVRTADPRTAGTTLARYGSVALTHSTPDLAVVADDARRVGATVWPTETEPSEARPEQPTDDDPDGLSAETAALLDKLAEGMSVAEAAAATHMSLRTAQRRLGDARRRYRVTTTPGAVAAWVRRRRG